MFILYFLEMQLAPEKKDRLHKGTPTFRSKKDSFQSKGLVWRVV